ICESAFQKKDHANIIPNLLVYGDILCSVGEPNKALETLKKAEEIHNSNFKPGQKHAQLERCKQKIKKVKRIIGDDTSHDSSHSSTFNDPTTTEITEITEIMSGGTPLIVFTDVGKDVDDAIALVVLACLKRMFVLNPVAVIATLSPQEERARLARVVLDSLGLPDVPVGIGTDGGSKDSVELHCFASEEKQLKLLHGSVLVPRILTEAEPKSVTLLCLANTKDVSQLILKHPDLFSAKVKNVVIMGGAFYSERMKNVVIMGGAFYSERSERLEIDESAYNNNCEPAAARMLYLECQNRGIPTTTINRTAAYDCPFAISKLNNLQLKCNHLLASEIHEANTNAILNLWKKVNMPAWMRGRGKLPARCDREWFSNFFQVQIDDDAAGPAATDSWLQSANIYLYDALATLNCVEAYQELYFCPKRHVIDGTVHKLVERVAHKEALVAEIDGFLHESFRLAMEGTALTTLKTKTSDAEESVNGDHLDGKEEKTQNGGNGKSHHSMDHV
ncbi:hypothetical protein ACHAWC_007253, partial [Mediolabrus comicus]